ncbi:MULTISPECIES: nuclear transport factor 2 family protein [unclassified Modestobacter]
MTDQMAALEARIAELEQRLTRTEDEQAIRRLQYQYGYYLDKTLYEEVVELFADDGAEVHFLHGVFHGKEGVRRLYVGRFMNKFADGHNGPRYGRLLDHPQMQGVITVAEDGLSARGRFRSIMQAGNHETVEGFRQWWEGGIYENQYVKQDGQWRIKVLNFRSLWQGQFDQGWSKAPVEYGGYLTETYPADPNGPDEIVDDWGMFPRTELVPFHYQHPVTGETVTG